MREHASSFWFVALGAVAALYVWSRTKQGRDALEYAAEQADIGADVIANVFSKRGYRNNNPGNIRFIQSNAWRGQVGNDGGYGIYDTPQNGTRALGHELLKYASNGLGTVREIISRWAPSTENNTIAYINHVAEQLNVDADAPLDVAGILPQLAEAIAVHENGYADASYDWNWVYLS